MLLAKYCRLKKPRRIRSDRLKERVGRSRAPEALTRDLVETHEIYLGLHGESTKPEAHHRCVYLGGLLTKMTAIDSGMQLWPFSVPPDS